MIPLFDIGPNPIALRTASGHYVAAEHGGGGAVDANGTTIGPRETFEVVPLFDIGPDKIALRTANGHFWAAEASGEVNANRDDIGEWETFQFICIALTKSDADGRWCHLDIMPGMPRITRQIDRPLAAGCTLSCF